MPRHPLGRHERGDRDRQHGDFGREARLRGQIVEHAAQRELGKAACDKQAARAVSAGLFVHCGPLNTSERPRR